MATARKIYLMTLGITGLASMGLSVFLFGTGDIQRATYHAAWAVLATVLRIDERAKVFG